MRGSERVGHEGEEPGKRYQLRENAHVWVGGSAVVALRSYGADDGGTVDGDCAGEFLDEARRYSALLQEEEEGLSGSVLERGGG